uniref:Uncharacterized protein n=1 Tax=Arundo donax TaxID=35708 RepID=A0A0A9F1P0_ARUDO
MHALANKTVTDQELPLDTGYLIKGFMEYRNCYSIMMHTSTTSKSKLLAK